ncbi:unnamed protein product [Peronospora farinosa]|uniref:Cleavage/polyadenylation specificity factor A subunit N-terminal domain-containing protein n=1 Tax=Peronospora farinosa TaxID=134698 RepID=A0AAV0U7Q2_9STRA|nr:unnamed protein product [Peronospora farinosa]CAI5732418.1 unnamed protein product [Peronospora farinosa]
MGDTVACRSRELTCAHGCHASRRVYVGFVDGSVRAIAANVPSDPGCRDGTELSLTHVYWHLRVCENAVTNVCGIEANEKDKGTLLFIGSASGELVVLREQLEIRRFQLEGAIQQICDDVSGIFVVGDALGNIYGITLYEILWKVGVGPSERRLPAFASRNSVGLEYFYPDRAQPTVQAITHARLLDVEKTLSNYILVATGQKYLVLTNCGKEFGTVPTRTPIAALASISAEDEDIVLASGEEGIIYRLESYRDMRPKDMPDFRFAMKVWAQVSFPVMKLLFVKNPYETKTYAFAWICLGVNGEVALFRSQECVKQWEAASFLSTQDVEPTFPVDLTQLDNGDNDSQQSGAVVFPDRIHTFSIEQWLNNTCNRAQTSA